MAWERLNHPLLALIFTRLPTDEFVQTVPFVCRGWRDAVAEPDCWSVIDIEKWSHYMMRTDFIDFAISQLVCRSRHALHRLSAQNVGNSGFSYITFYGARLRVLQIPYNKVIDHAIGKYARSLTALRVLDISYSKNITFKGIEILGKNCMSLVHLKRNLRSFEYDTAQGYREVEAKNNEAEALAVANSMPRLEQLELVCGHFSNLGLEAILNNCKVLFSLDLRGCSNVNIAGDIGRRCQALKSFKFSSYQYSYYDELDD